MTKHTVFLPASYAAIVYSAIECLGLALPLYVGMILHHSKLLATHCGPNHYEYWPSISTTIGDAIPERQIWRVALLITFPLRVIVTFCLFSSFFNKGSLGAADLRRFAFKPTQLIRSSSFWAVVMLWMDLWRWIAAFAWSMVVSSEIHAVHNFGFLSYIVTSIFFHLACTGLVWRNRFNRSIYPSQSDSSFSLLSKCFFVCGQAVCAFCVIVFYLRHQATCADGSYSLANMFEWGFAFCNLAFDGTMWYDLKCEGVWLMGPPSSLELNVDPSRRVLPEPLEPVASTPYREALFKGSDIVVHTVTFQSPPSDTLMWFCETYWSYMYFACVVHGLQHMYFQPLVAMSVTWEIVAGFACVSPVLLTVPWLQRRLCGGIPFFRSDSNGNKAPMYILFYLISAVAPLHQLITNNARRKLLTLGVCPFFLHLAIYCRYLYPQRLQSDAEEMQISRRMIYVFPLGLALNMLLRLLHISVDPMFVDPFYGAVFGIGLGLFFTLTIYRNAMFHDQPSAEEQSSEEGDHNMTEGERKKNSYSLLVDAYRPTSQVYSGILYGTLHSFALMFLTSANVLPRFLAVDPYPASCLVVIFFLSGVCLSPSILPITTRVQEGSKHRGIRAFFFRFQGDIKLKYGVGFLVLTGFLFLFGTRQTNFTYSSRQYTYHQEGVSIADWKVQENFGGSKTLAFLGGLCMLFSVGVLFPVLMELTWVQKRYRYAHKDGKTKICRFSTFEVFSCSVYGFFTFAFIVCLAYPFVPMGELFREKTRFFIIVMLLLLIVIPVGLLRRTRSVKLDCLPSIAYAQRSLPLRMVGCVVFLGLLIMASRAFRQPTSLGYPNGDPDFAKKYQPYILCAHDKLLQVKKARNGLTDEALSGDQRFLLSHSIDGFDWATKNSIINDGCYEHSSAEGTLKPLKKPERQAVYEVAKAFTDFSILIWTIHFALDNYDTDSLWRLTEVVRDMGASVIGILESDANHVQNGNRDIVEYLSYYLGFPYTDNGPASMDNSFGCAMISRYPIVKVKRYMLPSPLGELACMIHATLDVKGVLVETYVSHFGNTQHDADGALQSQFLGQVVQQTPGPSVWVGYVVSYPGNPDRYQKYSDPNKPGYLRDAAHFIYRNTPWLRLSSRGGFDETPPAPREFSKSEQSDFNLEAKIPVAKYLEEGIEVDQSFRRNPPDQPPRTFYFNETNRFSHAHPRFEFLDRYCQYSFFKTGQPQDELPQYRKALQPYSIQLFDWMRRTNDPVTKVLSDTEIQMMQVRFVKTEDSEE